VRCAYALWAVRRMRGPSCHRRMRAPGTTATTLLRSDNRKRPDGRAAHHVGMLEGAACMPVPLHLVAKHDWCVQLASPVNMASGCMRRHSYIHDTQAMAAVDGILSPDCQQTCTAAVSTVSRSPSKRRTRGFTAGRFSFGCCTTRPRETRPPGGAVHVHDMHTICGFACGCVHHSRP